MAPPRSELRTGEGDTAALKTYDERPLLRLGPGSPDQRSAAVDGPGHALGSAHQRGDRELTSRASCHALLASTQH